MSHVNVLTDEKTLKCTVVERPIHLVGGRPVSPHIAVSDTLPPILTPPVEIISRIIELGTEVDRVNFTILISHVCGRLRDIALATPMLWTDVSYRGGKVSYDEVQARLDRSAQLPLDVNVFNLETREDGENMLDFLLPHLYRWRSANLNLGNGPAAEIIMRALADQPAPILESLTLSGNVPSPVEPFGGQAPNLRNLHVKNMSLKWDSPIFHNLSSLFINSSSWRSASLLGDWQKLTNLVIRSEPTQPLVFHFALPHVVLPELECLELNGVTEEDIVRMLSHVEMPTLSRILFTHIKDSPSHVSETIFPLPSVRQLRLHATEMCQDNLLSVLRKVRNLDSISFEDSSPIPAFIHELTPTPATDSEKWVIPAITSFKVVAFEKDNAHRVYDDTDIAEALRKMMWKRKPVKQMAIHMCIFAGERDDVTRHAAPWDVERAYKSERKITVDS